MCVKDICISQQISQKKYQILSRWCFSYISYVFDILHILATGESQHFTSNNCLYSFFSYFKPGWEPTKQNSCRIAEVELYSDGQKNKIQASATLNSHLSKKSVIWLHRSGKGIMEDGRTSQWLKGVKSTAMIIVVILFNKEIIINYNKIH